MRLGLSLREAVHPELVITPSNVSPSILFISGRITQAAYQHETPADFAAAISNVGGRHAVFDKPCPLRGFVAFTLSKPRRFESFEIVLVGNLYLQDPDLPGHPTTPAKVDENLKYRINLLDRRPDQDFAAGNHRLEFNIVLPSQTPPSFASQYGGQAYHAQVLAQDDEANVYKSSKRELTLVNVTPSFDLNDYLANLSGSHNQLGSFTANLLGYPPTVGCVTLFRFKLYAARPGSTLISLSLSLVQTYKLDYVARKGDDGHKAIDVKRSIENKFVLLKAWNTQKGIQTGTEFPIFSKKPRPMQADDTLECEARVRLPLHHEILPTTPSHLDALPICLSHRMQLEVAIRAPDGQSKMLTYRAAVYLLSCRCAADTVVSPPYEADDSNASHSIGKRSQAPAGECACTTPDDKFIFPEPGTDFTELSEEARRLRDKLPNYEEATSRV